MSILYTFIHLFAKLVIDEKSIFILRIKWHNFLQIIYYYIIPTMQTADLPRYFTVI